jgi:hypothetical protein
MARGVTSLYMFLNYVIMVHILIKWSIDKRVIQVVLLCNIIFHLRSCLVKKPASLLHFCYSNRERFIVQKQYCINIYGIPWKWLPVMKLESQSKNHKCLDFLGPCSTLWCFTSYQNIFTWRPKMCKFNIIENAQEFSAILLHCDEAVNCLAYDYNKHLN